MNRVLTALTILTAASGPVFAAAAQPVAQQTTQAVVGPKIQVVPSEIDFGEIDDANVVSKTITLTNVGDAVLMIPKDSVKGSCGCTVPDLSKTQLEPGESLEMTVKFDPRNRSGSQPKTVTIAPHGVTPTVVKVDAFVIQRVQFVESFVSFASVDQGEAPTQFLRVRGMDPEFEVTEAAVTRDDVFSARVVGTEVVQREHPVTGDISMVGQSTIEVTLKADAPVGRHDASLKVKTSDSVVNEHETRIQATINGDLRLDPPAIRLGALQPGQSFEQAVDIYSNRGDSFEVSRVVFVTSDLSDEDKKKVTTELEPISDDSGRVGYRVTIRGEVSPTMRLVRGKIVMVTDAPGQRVVSCTMVGVVRGGG